MRCRSRLASSRPAVREFFGFGCRNLGLEQQCTN
jgi:hypothetical protein